MSREKPLVTIGLPVYNCEKTIERALQSLLAQTYKNLEIIVSDNASVDETKEICSKYASLDNRIQFSCNEKNLGINENFRLVFARASGKYFMWAAGDDYWEPDFVRALLNELESDPLVGVAFCGVRRIYEDGNTKDIIDFAGGRDPKRLKNFAMATKLLSPRDSVKDLKYNLFICGLFRYEALQGACSVSPNILSYGERALLYQVSLGYKFAYVDKVLFVKTIYELHFKDRNPEDEFVSRKGKTNYRKYYYCMIIWTLNNRGIPWSRKFFVFWIPFYVAYKFMHKIKKKIKKRVGP